MFKGLFWFCTPNVFAPPYELPNPPPTDGPPKPVEAFGSLISSANGSSFLFPNAEELPKLFPPPIFIP